MSGGDFDDSLGDGMVRVGDERTQEKNLRRQRRIFLKNPSRPADVLGARVKEGGETLRIAESRLLAYALFRQSSGTQRGLEKCVVTLYASNAREQPP